MRVSSREQKEEGFSIPAQKRLLWDFARKNGFQVVKEFEDDETAKSAGRTNFGAMVDYLKANKDINTVLVEKTDRLYRNFKDYVLIDELGVTVFLVKENEIIGKEATSNQKFIHGIKVLMAKNYVDNLSEEVKKGLRQKAEQGLYPCSIPPLGYKMGKLDGKAGPIVDELNRDLIVAMYERFATGRHSLKSLKDELNAEGLVLTDNFQKSSKLKTISKSTVQRILRNPIYYGDFIWKGKLHIGVHEPIVSRTLWDKVQEILSGKEGIVKQVKWGTKHFAFKGLLECGECFRTVSGDRKIKKTGKEYVYYRCTKHKTDCSQKPINENKVDKQILDTLKDIQLPKDTIAYITEALKDSLSIKRNTTDRERKRLEEQKGKMMTRLDRLYEDKLDGNITEEFYNSKFEDYTEKVKGFDRHILNYTQADIDYYRFGSSIFGLASMASKLYQMANDEEKRELLGFLFSNCQLLDRKLVITYRKPFDIILRHNKSFRTQENGLTKSKNTLSGASDFNWRIGRDSNPQLPP